MLTVKACRETLSRKSCRGRSLLMLKPLKPLMGQNVKSPFSNIRAVTSKLYSRSSRILGANRAHSASRSVLKSP
jgi:hypothetical protein